MNNTAGNSPFPNVRKYYKESNTSFYCEQQQQQDEQEDKKTIVGWDKGTGDEECPCKLLINVSTTFFTHFFNLTHFPVSLVGEYSSPTIFVIIFVNGTSDVLNEISSFQSKLDSEEKETLDCGYSFKKSKTHFVYCVIVMFVDGDEKIKAGWFFGTTSCLRRRFGVLVGDCSSVLFSSRLFYPPCQSGSFVC